MILVRAGLARARLARGRKLHDSDRVMRAFAIDQFGAAGSVRELPIPEPGDDEVLVRVHAASVNVMDRAYVTGMVKDYLEHRFPLVPGIDFSGVIERVGAAVDGVAADDEVYGVVAKPFVGAGSMAEFVAVGAGSVARKPRDLSHAEAAVMPHAGLTALAAVDAAAPQPGQVVLVVGATGGVGTFVTQMTAARGATVIAVTRGAGIAQAREYGASETVDYTGGDVVDQVRARFADGVDALIDMHSDAPEFGQLGTLVRPGGIAVSTRGAAAAAATDLEQRGIRYATANREAPDRLPEISALFEGGQLKVPPLKTFPLEESGAAIAEIGAGHVRGKLAITVR